MTMMKKNPINVAALIASVLMTGVFSASAATMEVDKSKSKIGFNASATGHTFAGSLKDYKISASGDEATRKPTSLELSWNFDDLDSANDDRDAQMLKWLGGGTQMGSFKFTKVTTKNGTDWVEGSLTIHGVTKTIQFPITLKVEGDVVTTSGKVTINYKDFDLPIIRSMLVMTVDPELTISFTLVGKAK